MSLSVIWADVARRNLRAIDRVTALEILHCLGRYLKTQVGNVKKLVPPRDDYRLRCGDYRLFFDFIDKHVIRVTDVVHRRQSYR